MTLVDSTDLLGQAEAAAIAGLKQSAFRQARQRGNVPEPIVKLSCGPIFLRPEIEEWAAERAARK